MGNKKVSEKKKKKLKKKKNLKKKNLKKNFFIRECRGIIFYKESKKIAARRFHKFFNIGEFEETSEEKINLSMPHSIVTKYDG